MTKLPLTGFKTLHEEYCQKWPFAPQRHPTALHCYGSQGGAGSNTGLPSSFVIGFEHPTAAALNFECGDRYRDSFKTVPALQITKEANAMNTPILLGVGPRAALSTVSARIERLKLSQLRTDTHQGRAAVRQPVVNAYAELSTPMPPVEVFTDGRFFYLVNGIHRYYAVRRQFLMDELGMTPTITAKVMEGTRREAFLYSLYAPSTSPLVRSHADKRHAVGQMLQDPEWGDWSNRQIAKACGVTHTLVEKLRAEFYSPLRFSRREQVVVDLIRSGRLPAAPAAIIRACGATRYRAGVIARALTH